MQFSELWEKMKKNWFFSAALCALGGLLLVLFPEAALNSLCYILGGFAIAAGVIRIIRYFEQDHSSPVLFQSDLIVGVFSLGLGLFMVGNPQAVESAIPTIFGILLVGFGIGNILRALDAKKAGNPRWSVLMGMAAFSALLGAVILSNPFAVMRTAVIVIGAALIYEGVTDILLVFFSDRRGRE